MLLIPHLCPVLPQSPVGGENHGISDTDTPLAWSVWLCQRLRKMTRLIEITFLLQISSSVGSLAQPSEHKIKYLEVEGNPRWLLTG